jgi:hypothetical protein
MEVANTVAYYDTATIVAEKSFIVLALHSNGRLLALSTNIILGWKWMEVANTVAYYDTATIMAEKSFKA